MTAFASSAIALPTKLRPPGLPADRIRRSRLIEYLDRSQATVAIVVAPAGFGKTTLLTQWCADHDEPVGWLSLGPEDNVLPTFLFYLLEAFATIEPRIVDAARSVAREGDPVGSQAVFLALLNELAAHALPWTLVIDDYHAIDNPEVDDAVERLIDAAPEGARLVIASRTEPRLRTARLRMLGKLTSLPAGSLRVTGDELADLLAGYGVVASDDERRRLAEHTDGWIGALRMTAIMSRGCPLGDVLDGLATRGAGGELLGEYLLQEVLDQQPPELRTFLLRTSIFDRFTPDACLALAAAAVPRRMIDQIRRRGLFLVDLDQDGDWLRYHHLFGDFLRARLEVETTPEAIRALYLAASGWFEQQQLFDEAISYAIKAEDWARAARLIAPLATASLLQLSLQDLHAWLQSFPPKVVRDDPDLSSIAAYTLVRLGRASAAPELIESAEHAWGAAGARNGLALVQMIRSSIARFKEDPIGLQSDAARAIAYATGDTALTAEGRLTTIEPRLLRLEGSWIGPYPQLMSYGHLMAGLRIAGNVTDAADLMRRTERYLETLGVDFATAPFIATSYVAAEAAAVCMAQGLLPRAESLARECLRQREHPSGSERMLAHSLLGDILREWNRLDESEAELREGLAVARRIDSPIILPNLQITLAQTLWSLGRFAEADAALNDASESALALRNLRRARQAEALRVRFALAAGDLDRARRWSVDWRLDDDTRVDSIAWTERLVHARVLLALDEADEAVRMLSLLRASAERDGRQHDLIRTEVVLSLAWFDLFDLDRAVDTLGSALERAEPGGYVRAFIDEGTSMMRLLHVARRRGVMANDVERMLRAAGESPGEIVKIQHRELVEPITNREMDVLRLLAVGLANREISDELFISVATVKRHISNIYSKLGVTSRADAIHKARRLGLLSGAPRP